MKLLLDHGADINLGGNYSGGPLHAATFAGNKALVSQLLEMGANIDAPSSGFGRPLQIASFSSDDDLVRFLLSKGASVNTAPSGRYGFPIQAAAVGGTTADNNDPDGLTSLLDSELGPSVARSYDLPLPKLHALLDAGRAEFDEGRRRAIYSDMQREALAQSPMVGLAWRSQGYAMAKAVQGFRNMPGALTFLSGTTLEDTSLG